MTYIETIAAVLILILFIFGFSQILFPLYNTWESASEKYRTVCAVQFIADSFRNECLKTNCSFEDWKLAIKSVRELENCELNEYWQDNTLQAVKAVCIVQGERIEIMGVCTQ